MIKLRRHSDFCHPHLDAADHGGPLQLAGADSALLEMGRSRLVLCALFFMIAFAGIGARLVELTLFNQPHEPQLDRAERALNLPLERADIVDRNGVVLATSLETASLYADPKMLRDAAQTARDLAKLLPALNEKECLASLQESLKNNRSFVWLAHNLTQRQKYEIGRLGIGGLYFQTEQRRVYPHGAITGHVVGFTSSDNRGLAGIERRYEPTLSKGGGTPLVLSLDLRVQHILREELEARKEEFHADGAGAAVLDVKTGELIALVSLPDFDANHAGDASDEQRFNRMTLGVYEMGSVFKVFTAAMTLEAGTATLASRYDASEPIHISRFTISDYHPMHRALTVPEIFMYSSNIGAARMALELGGEAQESFLGRFGLLTPARIDLPEVGVPEVPAAWHPVNTMTIAFGHGVSVAPIQVAIGTAAIVNGGILHDASLLKRRAGDDAPGVRVISENTSEEMRRLLRLVVTDGTGKEAAADGYLVGGKTGTAEKAVKHGYARHMLLSSFDGVFPMNAPRYVVFAFYDSPHGDKATHNFATGGWVAAPVVSRVIQRIAPILGVSPVDEKDPAIQKALWVEIPDQDRKLASN
jgi:cell division protein FtsI (penicillin-binding protein 3)